ncbi:MAG: hypothetical protein H7Y13_10095 [Sphingobacteriaceae bacterium]|nr:hypothetical protein [Sphingobacteriaceae bacterium]
MKKNILLIFFIALSGYSEAQTFASLQKKSGNNPMTVDMFKLYVRQTSVSTKYNGNYGGLTINIGLRDDNFKKWQKRMRYENPTLGDFFYGIPKAVRDVKKVVNDEQDQIKANTGSDHGHGGGFFGWMQYYVNIVAKDRLLISPGVSFGDYIYGSQTKDAYNFRQDPYGYFLTAGPSVMASYLINKKMWVDGYATYDISYLKAENGDNPYPKPTFLTVGADLYTTSKLFGGIRLNTLQDKGSNKDKSTRIDFSIGIVF